MRLTGIALGAFHFAAPAAAQFIDRDAVFTRAREVAAASLPGVESADLVPFQIAYDLTLLETGNPAGGFGVALLLTSSREVLAARRRVFDPAVEPRSGCRARGSIITAGT